MSTWFHQPTRAADPPMLMPDTAPLTEREVRELWAFLHGDIMIGGIREHLRRAFGLCPRHTWGYAAVEIELWLFGPEPRGGHIPFDVGILYDDLLEYTAGLLAHAHGTTRHGFQQLLTPHATCRICDSIAPSGVEGVINGSVGGYAGSNSAELTKEANAFSFTQQWCARTREIWTDSACPSCLGRDHEPEDTVLLCRRHLMEAGPVEIGVPHAIAARLEQIRQRLSRMVGSMTDHGLQATVGDDSSVIEALGWFAGWEFPIALTRKPPPSTETRRTA